MRETFKKTFPLAKSICESCLLAVQPGGMTLERDCSCFEKDFNIQDSSLFRQVSFMHSLVYLKLIVCTKCIA